MKFARWIPTTKRGRVLLLLAAAVLLAIGSIIGGIYHAEISGAYGRWRNRMPQNVWQRLYAARSASLYSLYPDKVAAIRDQPWWVEDMTKAELLALPRFQNYPVFGEFDCTDTDLLQLIADELRAGTQNAQSGFMCHYPRHGLRITDGEGTLELAVCFECERFDVVENGKFRSHHVFLKEPSFRSRARWSEEFSRRGIRMAGTTPRAKPPKP